VKALHNILNNEEFELMALVGKNSGLEETLCYTGEFSTTLPKLLGKQRNQLKLSKVQIEGYTEGEKRVIQGSIHEKAPTCGFVKVNWDVIVDKGNGVIMRDHMGKVLATLIAPKKIHY
jgi:hypothetical protein